MMAEHSINSISIAVEDFQNLNLAHNYFCTIYSLYSSNKAINRDQLIMLTLDVISVVCTSYVFLILINCHSSFIFQ